MDERMKKNIATALKGLLCILCALAMIPLLLSVALSENFVSEPYRAANIPLVEKISQYIATALSDAEAGARSIPKRFWIGENSPIPPRDPAKYGTAATASELQWLLDEAATLLDGQETLFHTGIEILEGTEITYYLDETILTICWQELRDNIIYTIAEVKVVDPSQFRRGMAEGYGTENRYTTMEMSAQVSAVVASSGDHYLGRAEGIVVYDGELLRYSGTRTMDICFVDRDGNLIMSRRKTFQAQEEAEAFIKEHNIEFSIAFGPALISDGVRCEKYYTYPVGENSMPFPRTAICQRDELHYLLVTATGNDKYKRYPTIDMFTDQIETLGVQQAYTLDGGKTGVIVMEDKHLSPFDYPLEGQRKTGDMLFFVTAVPGEK